MSSGRPPREGRGRGDPVPHAWEQARQPRTSTRPVPAAQAGLGSAPPCGGGRGRRRHKPIVRPPDRRPDRWRLPRVRGALCDAGEERRYVRLSAAEFDRAQPWLSRATFHPTTPWGGGPHRPASRASLSAAWASVSHSCCSPAAHLVRARARAKARIRVSGQRRVSVQVHG